MITRLASTATDCVWLAAICFAGGSLMILLGGMEGFLLITFGFLLLVAGLFLLPLTLLTSSNTVTEPADTQPADQQSAPEPTAGAEDPPEPALDLDADPLEDFHDQ